jgi:hypothetical protein
LETAWEDRSEEEKRKIEQKRWEGREKEGSIV